MAVFMKGEQKSFGGTAALLMSSVVETVMALLQAPIRMLAHSLFVLVATLGSVFYDGFFSAQVFLNLLIDNAFLIVVAVGMTF
eukprot:gene19160-38389_t